ncbi:MAG: DUF4416 family protein [Candidatus Omnitrophica bacterium]|nr:DUF4416 family protein [Candidatus Omnitrophota bacterium]
MGSVVKHSPVKLIIGFIGQEKLFTDAQKILSKKFGKIDYESAVLGFDFTDYYEKEMGRELKRKFLSFKRLIQPAALPLIKVFTNELEKKFFSENGKRALNIDPGYLSLSKLVLATTKDHQHRLYLDKGIFAEVTLRFRDKTFQKWDWTYPDYCTREYISIFNQIRNDVLKKDLHGNG